MFFAIDLLIPQHGGKFSVAWIAATRGIHYVGKKDITQCDIINLCDDILKMVQSSSSRPRLRLSLSLASRLINGVTKIYRRQVEISIDELQAFFFQIRGPKMSSSTSLDETSRGRMTGVRRRRRRNIVQLSDEPSALAVVPVTAVGEDFLAPIIIDEEELARPSVHQVDSDLITLREELPMRPRQETDMGEFDVLEDVEPPILPGAPLQAPVPSLSEIVTAATPEKRKATSVLGTPSKRRGISQMQVEALEESEAGQPQVEIQVVPDITQPEPPTIHEIPDNEEPSELEAQTAVVPEPVVPLVERTTKRRVPQYVAKTDIVLRRRHAVNINRCLPKTRERMDVSEYENHVPVEITDSDERLDSYDILKLFMENQPPEEVEELFTQLRASSKIADSLLRTSSLMLTRKTVAPDSTLVPSVVVIPAVVEPVLSLQPHDMPQTVEDQIPMEIPQQLEVPDKTIKPIAESTGISLPQLDIETPIHPSERTIEIIMPPVAETARVRRALIPSTTSSEMRRVLIKDRQKQIRDIVKNWNFEQQGEITIEDVCMKPINRVNIALAFNDLLSLCKMEYVKLNNNPDSLELETIEKGRRILSKRK